jgi:hypothetical protein
MGYGHREGLRRHASVSRSLKRRRLSAAIASRPAGRQFRRSSYPYARWASVPARQPAREHGVDPRTIELTRDLLKKAGGGQGLDPKREPNPRQNSLFHNVRFLGYTRGYTRHRMRQTKRSLSTLYAPFRPSWIVSFQAGLVKRVRGRTLSELSAVRETANDVRLTA